MRQSWPSRGYGSLPVPLAPLSPSPIASRCFSPHGNYLADRFGDCVSTPAARDIGPTTILSRHAIRIVLIPLLMVTDSRDFACAGKLSASLAW